jgi:hypothetical protein
MPNIFMISSELKPEDRFTISWEYLLYRLPELGQTLINYISENSGIGSSRFVEALDQSKFAFSNKDKPDFLILCQDYWIVCEHKLNSPEKNDQLKRYCDLIHPEKELYVLFISNKIGEKIDDVVFNNPKYLRPSNSIIPYYQWESFYHIVKSSDHILAKEFTEYMEDLGMDPWPFDGNDPFVDETAGKQFKNTLKPIMRFFKDETNPKSSQMDPVSLGFSIRKPDPKIFPIRVFHLIADKTPGHLNHGLKGRGIFLEIKGHTDSNRIKKLPDSKEIIETDIGQITTREPEYQKPDSGGYILLREYAISLENVLVSDDKKATEGNILTFSKECLKHLRNTIKNLSKLI